MIPSTTCGWRFFVALTLCLATTIPAWAAKAPKDGLPPDGPAMDGVDKPQGKGRPSGKGGPPEQRMLLDLQQGGEMSEDEWRVLFPHIEKVQTLSRQIRELRDSKKAFEPPKPPKGGGNADGGPADRPQSPPPTVVTMDLAQKTADLKAVWEDKTARADDIQRRLVAFRDARAKAEQQLSAELTTAKAKLRELLTARQELALVMMGLLD